ncbi:Thioredoxin-like [Chitinophaga sp. YR573]|uniref:TlpA family protein disulfide reductase n=1 Tax=Chitinophaga sp. YR573 TaxID=1881040 RepID=UPI0008D3A928|nr:thioredoxin-like domain-containing protein [Chitinophaga sp. YR573]SEW04015.1 Thioredoxin-like [Chitinophaga sp. YR573]
MKMLLLIIIVLINIVSCTRQEPTQQTKLRIDSLPPFNILLMDTTTRFNTAKISYGSPIVLFFFGPDCPHCQALTRDIITHVDSLKDIRFFFLSIAGFHDIKVYDSAFKLNRYNNITVGQDYNNYFFNYYRAPGFPFLVIYNGKKMLKQVIIGAVGLDSIRTVINK